LTRRVGVDEGPDALAALLAQRALREPVAFVGIDGGGGAGKSTLAERVSVLRRDVRIVHLDDFFRTTEADPGSLDLERLEREAVAPLSAGQPTRFRRFDWWSVGVEEWHTVEPGRVVVLEGVFALQPALRPLYDVTVWVETPSSVRLARGLERDGEERREEWHDWMSAEARYVADLRPAEWVDLVVG
jgi:uridine kinase